MGWISNIFRGKYLEWDDYVKKMQELDNKQWKQCEDKKVNYSS